MEQNFNPGLALIGLSGTGPTTLIQSVAHAGYKCSKVETAAPSITVNLAAFFRTRFIVHTELGSVKKILTIFQNRRTVKDPPTFLVSLGAFLYSSDEAMIH